MGARTTDISAPNSTNHDAEEVAIGAAKDGPTQTSSPSSTDPVDAATQGKASSTRGLGQPPPLHTSEAANILPEACSLTTGEEGSTDEVRSEEKPVVVSPIEPEESTTNSTGETASNSAKNSDSDEDDSPMPDRKKRRLINRVPSRSFHVMSGKELRKECLFWGLPVTGRKDILISRLEANTKGQKILPFRLVLTTPCKRTRQQSCSGKFDEDDDDVHSVKDGVDSDDDDDEIRPSQKEMKLEDDNEGTRTKKEEAARDEEGMGNSLEKDDVDDDEKILTNHPPAPPTAVEHPLKEPSTQAVTNLQVISQKSSISFHSKSKLLTQSKLTTFFSNSQKSHFSKLSNHSPNSKSKTFITQNFSDTQCTPSRHSFNPPTATLKISKTEAPHSDTSTVTARDISRGLPPKVHCLDQT